MHLANLPLDIILDICRHLHAYDIISLRLTCKVLESATRESAVWHIALSAHTQQSRLPVPNVRRYEPSTLSASELERLTLSSLRYWLNWLSPRPRFYRHLDIKPARLTRLAHHRGARNLSITFIPGIPDHILTLTLYGETIFTERYCFELWSIVDDSQATFVDTVAVAGLLGYAVNSVPDSTTTLTITRRSEAPSNLGATLSCVTMAYSLDSQRPQGDYAFQLLRQFDGFRHTIGLHGSRLIATDAEQHLRIIDVDTGRLEYTLKAPLMLNDPTLHSAEQQSLDAIIVDNFVLSFCKQYIFLYHAPVSLPPKDAPGIEASDSTFESPELDAVAMYKWRWRIDTLIAAPRRSPRDLTMLSATATNMNAPPSGAPIIDVLTRFDTWFPWPVNILHHFVLAPNPAYHADTVDLANSETFPYLLSDTDGPFMVHSIPSPVRIFTPSDVVLGRYGTALWIDASTDVNTPSQAGDRGQRIAGKLLTQMPLPTERLRLGERPQDDNVSPGPVEPATLPSSGDPSGMADAAEHGPAVSVFHIQESDEKWNRVAVDEEGGRIALGDVNGTVSVYTYVPTERVVECGELQSEAAIGT